MCACLESVVFILDAQSKFARKPVMQVRSDGAFGSQQTRDIEPLLG